MNKARRKEIMEVSEKVGRLKGELEDMMSEVEELKAEEEDYKDGIPDNLHGSERYEMAESAIENLEEAHSSM